MGKKELIAIDLFSGAGGMSCGFEKAGIKVVTAIEFDQQIASTYQYNHPETKMIVDDIRNVKEDSLLPPDIPSCDIIFGGPPCQGFSMAGNRIRNNQSFIEDPRNFLFKEYIRIVAKLRPRVFVIENVPGILNYNNGAIKKEIFDTFHNLGYQIDARVLCAADFGVPQLRQRAVFIGNRLGIEPTLLFPIASHSKDNYVTVGDAILDLPTLLAGEGTEVSRYTINSNLSKYQQKMRENSSNLYNHISSHHSDATLHLMSLIKQGQTMHDLPKELQTKSVHSGAYGRMEQNKPCYTLTTRINTPSVGRITHTTQNRTITPREAARLQSFPDNYRFLGDITSVGKQIGNAVPPLLAQAIAEQLTEYL